MMFYRPNMPKVISGSTRILQLLECFVFLIHIASMDAISHTFRMARKDVF